MKISSSPEHGVGGGQREREDVVTSRERKVRWNGDPKAPSCPCKVPFAAPVLKAVPCTGLFPFEALFLQIRSQFVLSPCWWKQDYSFL